MAKVLGTPLPYVVITSEHPMLHLKLVWILSKLLGGISLFVLPSFLSQFKYGCMLRTVAEKY